MRIWYQSFSGIGFDPSWRVYEELLKSYVQKVARADTTIHVHGVERFAPRMVHSKYFQYLHLKQVVDNALKAEQEGYDAFVLGGMLDHGYFELREVVDIPVLFIGETAFYVACLMSPRFAVVAASEVVLRGIEENIKLYGLSERMLPGSHIGTTSERLLVANFAADPQPIIDKVVTAAKKVVDEGAGVIVPGFGGLSLFLVDRGVRQVEGVPILDNTGALIKMAEAMVDLRRMGVAKGRTGLCGSPSKDELLATRKLYGAEG